MNHENTILNAAKFAKKAHEGQTRRYSGAPYIVHPAHVAATVCTLDDATDDMIVAAWLHDVLEDTDVPPEDIRNEFGDRVLKLVQELTNPSKGSKEPRRVRKQMDIDHLKGVSKEAKQIKLADRLENLYDLEGADDDFPALYAKESRALIEAIGDADEGLRVQIEARIVAIERKIG
jgi:(p)ppGpp synthase/HD superfamily hydrolase